jgi:hypothetical protein
MMFMRSVIVFIILILLIRLPLLAQERNYHVLKYKITGNDTLPFATISGAEIYAVRIFDNKRQANKNNRLIRNVKAVYPWAKLAGAKLVEYESILLNTESKKEQRKIMKQVENEIQEEYGGELRKLTISQGKILIKLIDRETGDTSYDLVQDFRGNFVAFFYQSFARIFGYNLKERYDPEGSDRNIEIIVKMIEQGMI